jgi:xylulokinase
MNIIGLDIGTSSVKALLVSNMGEVLKVSSQEYPFQTPRPLWAEADPEIWWQATKQAVNELLEGIDPGSISAIGLTGQMHGMVALDVSGQVLRSCIMWNDQRSHEECEEITSMVGAENVLKITGNPVLAGFTAPKIKWMQKNEPEIFKKVSKILLPKDYIRYRLTGEFFSDVSDASGTSLLNVGERKWSEEILQVLGWDPSWLPPVTESTEMSAKISSYGAEATGLLEGTPVAAGGGDCAAQAVGSAIVEEGKVSVTLGTSGVVFAQSDEYRVEPEGKLHAFCHAVPGKWHLMGVMLSAAGSFQWYKDTLGDLEAKQEEEGQGDAYEILTRNAESIAAGSEGLFFLPYLSGERTPYADPYAKGCFIGLTLRHQKEHFSRSVLEGVSYGLNDSLELMRKLGINPEDVQLSGGGTKSSLWKQMLADIFNAPCSMVNAREGAAYGAALLAAVGVGQYENVASATAAWIRTTETIQPSSEVDIYGKYYSLYQGLYPKLKETFNEISTLC